jgi:hypothetical protein
VSEFTVTGYAEVDGRLVTGTATAEVADRVRRRHGITEVIEIEVDARPLIAFAEIVERHAASLRRDLDRLMNREHAHEHEEGDRM